MSLIQRFTTIPRILIQDHHSSSSAPTNILTLQTFLLPHSLPSLSTLALYPHSLPSLSTLALYPHSLPSLSTLTLYPHSLLSLPSLSTLSLYPHSLPSLSTLTFSPLYPLSLSLSTLSHSPSLPSLTLPQAFSRECPHCSWCLTRPRSGRLSESARASLTISRYLFICKTYISIVTKTTSL